MKKSRVSWDERAGAALNARRHLPGLVTYYFAICRKVLQDDPPPVKLHRLRLESKRLRYTLELFRACYGPGLDRRIGHLRKVQQILGDLNDTAATRRLLHHMMKSSPLRLRATALLDARAAQQVEGFRRFWNEEFDAEGQENWWTLYLARHARPPGRRP